MQQAYSRFLTLSIVSHCAVEAMSLFVPARVRGGSGNPACSRNTAPGSEEGWQLHSVLKT